MADHWTRLAPPLTAAAGMIGGTAVAAFAPLPGLWIMVGPTIAAAAIFAAGVLNSRLRQEGPRGLLQPVILGSVVLMASLIIAVSDPSKVATLLPIVAAGPIFAVTPGRCGRARCTAQTPAPPAS